MPFCLKNIVKQYKTKGGKIKTAINNISFTLPGVGNVFLVGRSGSGKSTLLNLLSGLDKPTSGNIDYNGNSFSSYKDEDFANFRNSVVGFIFQEFNLLDNMTVEQNLMIPLSLHNKKNTTQIEEVLAKVGLSGYEKNKISQLSGGEKQRVGIARALVKKPKIIFADEPTGNLDSKTANEIFTLLKSLSEDCLVVTVTHDLVSANKYADFVIELADGEIIFNNCPVSEPKNEPLKRLKTSLPLPITAKMGAENLLKKPGRTASVLITAIFTIFCILLSQFFVTYSSYATKANLIKDKNISLVSLTQEHWENHSGTGRITFKQHSLDFLEKNYPQVSVLQANGNSISIESSEDVLKFGLNFLGDYEELTEDSIYIGENYVEFMYSNASYFTANESGELVKLLKNEYPPETLAGKTVIFVGGINSESYYIAGVVKTDNLFSANNELEQQYFNSRYGRLTFCLKNKFNNSPNMDYHSLNSAFNINKISLKTAANNFSSANAFNFLGEQAHRAANNCIVLADKFVSNEISSNENDLSLKDSEIVLSFQLYNKLFGGNYSPYNFIEVKDTAPLYTLKSTPPHIGEQISFNVSEIGYCDSIFSGAYTLAGVSFDFEDISSYSPVKDYMIFDNASFRKINSWLNIKELLVNCRTIPNVHKFVNDLATLEIIPTIAYSDLLTKVEEDFDIFKVCFLLLGILLCIVMMLFVINTIGVGILNRTKEIGILKALGAKNKDLFAIYFTEAFIISAITFIAGICLSFAVAAFLNYAVMVSYANIFKLFFVSWWSVLVVFIASFVFTFLATLFPLLKIKKLNPIDSLKTT